METLRDLNLLAQEVVQNFNDKFDAGDRKIPQTFKNKVKGLKSFSIVYNEYSVVIKGDGVRSKDSYVPNQSFFMASFFIEYSYELSKYKQKVLSVLSTAGISNNEWTEFFTHERDNGKDDITKGEDRFVQLLDNINYNETDREFLIRFVTDYNWWSGSKTIDRSDFFNSPVLNIMGLTASSNAAMALIVDYLTQNPNDSRLLLAQIEHTNQTTRVTESQIIYYGAPGTGKSKTIKDQTEEAEKDGRVFRTTFHPDSDYSTFVGCYKPRMKSSDRIYSAEELAVKLKEIKNSGVTYPCHKFAALYWRSLKDLSADTIKQILIACGFTETMNVEISKGVAIGQEYLNKDEDGKIIYTFTPQAFTNAYVKAWNTKENVYLIIEEINRGNCAQIFGDLFQLLDRGNDGRSEYPIDADSDLANYIGKELSGSTRDEFPEGVKEGKKLLLPENLHIWATMNTSDQSLFPIDSAFKRRWDWKYIKISEGKDSDTKKPLGWKIMVDDKDQNRVRLYDWWKFLQLINRRIYGATQSADKQMGYFFAKAKDHFNGKIVGRIIKDAVFEEQSSQISEDYITAETFVNKVLFYLWTDVMKDNEYEEITNLMEKKDGDRLTFPDFFGDSGMEINYASVRTFLDNVMKEEDEWCKIAELTNDKEEDSKVSNVSDEEIDDGLTEVDLKENGKKVNFSKVTFGDGTVIDEGDRFATYVAALKKFGLEKSAEIGENSKLHRQNLPLICKTVKQTPSSPYSYEEVDGIYIMKGTNSMHRMLIKIGKELNVTFRLD